MAAPRRSPIAVEPHIEDAVLLAEMARARGEEGTSLRPVAGRGLWHATNADDAFAAAARTPLPHEALAPVMMLDAAAAAGREGRGHVVDLTAAALQVLREQLRLACATNRTDASGDAPWCVDVMVQSVSLSGRAAAAQSPEAAVAGYRFEGSVAYALRLVARGGVAPVEVGGTVELGAAVESGQDEARFTEQVRTVFNPGEKAKLPAGSLALVNPVRGRFELSLRYFARRAETLLRRQIMGQ